MSLGGIPRRRVVFLIEAGRAEVGDSNAETSQQVNPAAGRSMIATFSDRPLPMTTPRFFQSAAIYTDHRAISLFFLGFAAGLPFLLLFSSLSIWLNEAGVDRGTVTRFSWAALAYSCKFIWSPLVDTLPLPLLTRRLGRRRAWLASASSSLPSA